MADKQKSDSFQVELAIQRELAYRKKVPFSIEKPILHRNSPPPRPNPKPHSIQETSTARPLIRSPNTFPNPFQKPNIPTKPRSDLKRKSVTTTDREPCRNLTTSTNNSNMALNKSVDNLLCELCQVSCSSALTMRQHLSGRPHKAKMEFMKLKRNCIGERKGKPRCDICQIWCSDRDGLEMHLKGQKHKAKMQELELCKKNGGGIVAKKPILCELCRVHSMNEDLFKMHLKGRQHAAREELKR
ncbi:hypothetical protein DH2020_013080 [Rehmannia glutinosa]|uniref:C2H2-type domain-containing protein n=1 Tax=Rehmannia glutinosa TaxID=99300 RepID=A0ABR0X1G7_REHGL